jgi:hypothetical protein
MTYGWQTKSWRNSTEKRQMDQERAAETERFLASQRGVIALGPEWMVCRCRSFDNPHSPERHREMSEFDWRLESQRHSMYREERVR